MTESFSNRTRRFAIVPGRGHALVFALLVVVGIAQPVVAQPRGFIGGNIFADMKRFSGDANNPSLDGTAFGAGGDAGIFVTPHWSVSLEIEAGRSTTTSQSLPIGILTPLAVIGRPISPFESRTTNRLLATSIMIGYRPSTAGRVHLATLAGLTFVHMWRRFETTGAVPFVDIAAAAGSTIGIPSGLVIPPISPLVIPAETIIDNVPAATVGADVAVDLASHLAVVPSLRAHIFSLSEGGPSGFAIRPAVGVRWSF